MRQLFKPALLAALAASALGAHAQGNVKPPKVQLWMDVSTGGMAGMPELPAGMGGMGRRGAASAISSTSLRPASGPKAMLWAIARLRSTTGEGATMRSRS